MIIARVYLENNKFQGSGKSGGGDKGLAAPLALRGPLYKELQRCFYM